MQMSCSCARKSKKRNGFAEHFRQPDELYR
jgi:hypothetical protein